MARQKGLDIIPPLAGEKVGTPDGEGVVVGTTTFWEHPEHENEDWQRKMRARMGKDFHRRYFQVSVEVDGDVQELECWEIEWDPDRELDSPWR
jgi:hypothetical protein